VHRFFGRIVGAAHGERAVRQIDHLGFGDLRGQGQQGVLRTGDRCARCGPGRAADRGNGDQPGENVNGPAGVDPAQLGDEKRAFALSTEPAHGFALLFKTESTGPTKCLAPGKPLEIKVTKDKEKLWLGFNDEKGRYQDNHLGKGKRHELDPLWVRIEVVRMTVD